MLKITGVKKMLAQIEKHKNKMATERDKIREIYEELEGLLSTFDEGIDNIEFALREIEGGIDIISQEV